MTIDVSTWDETPVNNSTIDGVSIAEACSPANVNNGLRAIMAAVKTFKLLYDALAASAATLTGTQTLTNKTLTSPTVNGGTANRPTFTGAAKQTDFTITDAAAFEIDPANGGRQFVVLGASRTPKATNMANGDEVLLAVDDGTAYTLTWTDATFGGIGVKWIGTASPSLGAAGWNWIALWKVSGQVYGSFGGNTG